MRNGARWQKNKIVFLMFSSILVQFLINLSLFSDIVGNLHECNVFTHKRVVKGCTYLLQDVPSKGVCLCVYVLVVFLKSNVCFMIYLGLHSLALWHNQGRSIPIYKNLESYCMNYEKHDYNLNSFLKVMLKLLSSICKYESKGVWRGHL